MGCSTNYRSVDFRRFARNRIGWMVIGLSLSSESFRRHSFCFHGSPCNTHCWRSVQKNKNPMSTVPSETTANFVAKDDVLFSKDDDLAVREEGDFIIYQIGPKAFRL